MPAPKPPGIPAIRERMHHLADEMEQVSQQQTYINPIQLWRWSVALKQMADQTYRVRRATPRPAKARSVNSPLAAAVLTYRASHPDALMREIGLHFNIDSGRVSEILTGKR
jgi:hypothetical protein